MKIPTLFQMLALAFSVGAPAFGHEFKLGDLTIEHPYAIETPASAKTGAGYMTITNTGAEADTLIEVRTAFPRALLHTTEVDADGVARMREDAGIEIGPGASVTLAPQGTHVMFMGLSAPLKAGERIDATLVFAKAGAIEVQFNVEARGDAAGADDAHAGHDMTP